MKHEKEINQLLENLFHIKGMSEACYNEIVVLKLKEAGITKQKISDDIETGVENGYPVRKQMEILEKALSIF